MRLAQRPEPSPLPSVRGHGGRAGKVKVLQMYSISVRMCQSPVVDFLSRNSNFKCVCVCVFCKA